MRWGYVAMAVVALAVAGGCASGPRGGAEVPGNEIATQPPPATVASTRDIAVAKEVSQLLKESEGMARLTSNIDATVRKGKVTLRGWVPSEHDRIEIAERVGLLPGVKHVSDKLDVEQR